MLLLDHQAFKKELPHIKHNSHYSQMINELLLAILIMKSVIRSFIIPQFLQARRFYH